MVSTYPMYICDRCGWGQYHPLTYCQMCPGKLHRRVMPKLVFKTEAERIKILANQGVKYTGEYPPITERRKLELSIARANEQLAIRAEELKRTVDIAIIEQLKCGTAHWESVVAKYQQKLDSLPPEVNNNDK